MKLCLGENIRKYRRKADLTQTQLAEKIGVSDQAVSRWENGTTYPDIELLPVLAGLFDCTLDELVGEAKDQKIERYWEELTAIPENGIKERCDVARRAFAECPNEFSFGQALCIELSLRCDIQDENVVNEVRHVALDILKRCTDDAMIRTNVLYALSMAETDDRIDEFLEQYVPGYDISRNTLLCKRYERRGEKEAYRMLTYRNNIDAVKRLLETDFDPTDPSPQKDPAASLPSLYAKLNFLNAIIGIDEETRRLHPVQGDGTPDMWFEDRMLYGLRISRCLATMGRTDDALDMLEEVTELCERFYGSVFIGDVLSYRTDKTGVSDMVVYNVWDNNGWRVVSSMTPDEKKAILQTAHISGLLGLFDAGRYYYCLVRREGDWAWFDPIREHPRYLACMERMKKAGEFA